MNVEVKDANMQLTVIPLFYNCNLNLMTIRLCSCEKKNLSTWLKNPMRNRT